MDSRVGSKVEVPKQAVRTTYSISMSLPSDASKQEFLKQREMRGELGQAFPELFGECEGIVQCGRSLSEPVEPVMGKNRGPVPSTGKEHWLRSFCEDSTFLKYSAARTV